MIAMHIMVKLQTNITTKVYYINLQPNECLSKNETKQKKPVTFQVYLSHLPESVMKSHSLCRTCHKSANDRSKAMIEHNVTIKHYKQFVLTKT